MGWIQEAGGFEEVGDRTDNDDDDDDDAARRPHDCRRDRWIKAAATKEFEFESYHQYMFGHFGREFYIKYFTGYFKLYKYGFEVYKYEFKFAFKPEEFDLRAIPTSSGLRGRFRTARYDAHIEGVLRTLVISDAEQLPAQYRRCC